jgi:ABC-type branched-subunit amino acid transport system substrate-binding protein
MVRDIDRRDVLKGIGVAGLAGVAGCLADDESANPTDRTINLGILMGVTGGLEQLGPPIRDAAELPPAQFDDADTDLTVDTQFEDTQTDPGTGVTGAEALDDAGYPMLNGALASAVSLEVARSVTIPRGIVQMSPASTAPEYSDLEADFTFRTALSDAFQGQLLARLAAERLDADSAGVLAQDDAYGQGLSDGFVEAFRNDFDGEITEQVIFAQGETSYTAQLESALSGDPDTLLVVAFPEDGVRIFSDFYSNFDRGDMPVLVSDGLQASDLPGQVGFDMTNVSGTAPIGDGPSLDTFRTLYEDTYDVMDADEFPFVRQAYDSSAVLLLANAAAGENDGEAVRDEIRNVSSGEGTEVTADNLVEGAEMAAEGEDIVYQGVSGPVTFDENGDQEQVAYQYFEFTEDGLENIEVIEL